MRRVCLVAVSTLAFLAAPVLAREPNAAADKPDRPITNKDVTAMDVVTTPATDLNLKKDEIPALLIDAQEKPYALNGLGGCRQLGAAIGDLDAVLGEDLDLPREGGQRMQPGRVAQSLVGSLIPFRGVIRELSGANARDRELQAAVIAGVARRSFLKGVGQTKGCRYPARSATTEVFNERMAALNAEQPTKARSEDAERSARESRDSATGQRYVAQPVVQRTD